MYHELRKRSTNVSVSVRWATHAWLRPSSATFSPSSAIRLGHSRRREGDDCFAFGTGKGIEARIIFARFPAKHCNPAERALLDCRSRLGGHCATLRQASLPAHLSRSAVGPTRCDGKNAKSYRHGSDYNCVCRHRTAPSVRGEDIVPQTQTGALILIKLPSLSYRRINGDAAVQAATSASLALTPPRVATPNDSARREASRPRHRDPTRVRHA
jgi:hypothetical protein